MCSMPASDCMAPIGRTAAGQPRTFRLEQRGQSTGSLEAAYRRLAAAILGVDVFPPRRVRRRARAAERHTALID